MIFYLLSSYFKKGKSDPLLTKSFIFSFLTSGIYSLKIICDYWIEGISKGPCQISFFYPL